MKIGCHVSCAGGVHCAPERAHDLGCETFQMFTRSPQGGKAPELSETIISDFKAALKKYQLSEFVVHAPYFVNLGSGAKNIFYGSVSVLKDELNRSNSIGARYMMVHLGSYKDLGREKGMEQVISGLHKILEGYDGTTKFLIENAAGAGSVVGGTFEELGVFVGELKDYPGFGGFCYDTQHGFASGYDIRTEKAAKKTFKEFETATNIGSKTAAKKSVDYLKMVHCNDSKIELGGKKDRHEHIGEGLIGREGFAAFLGIIHASEQKSGIEKPLILETEHDKVKEDILALKEIRDSLL